MLAYASEEDECRSVFLLRYFGQEHSAPCGHCDVCKEKGVQKEPGWAERLREAMMDYILREKSGEYTLRDVLTHFVHIDGTNETPVLDVLRDLLDEGVIPTPQ